MYGTTFKLGLALCYFVLPGLAACSAEPDGPGQVDGAPQQTVAPGGRGTTAVAASGEGARTGPEGAPEDCTAAVPSLQSEVDAAAPGSVVRAAPCVYRESVSIDKPITLDGGGVSEIHGSDVRRSSDFSPVGSVYESSRHVSMFGSPRVDCEPGTSRCRWPEQVYLDGRPLRQAVTGTAPSAGEFALDSDRHVVLGEDPDGKLVEVTTRDRWIKGASGGRNVTVRGFVMKHAAGDGISARFLDGWTVEENELAYAHSFDLRLNQSSGNVVRDNAIHHGGQGNVSGNEVSLRLVDNEIYEGNSEAFLASFHAGGVKLSNPHTVTYGSNDVHDNRGNGLWLDAAAGVQSVVVSNNRVHDNDGHGIKSEVTNDVDIFGNAVWNNGWNGEGDLDGGITLNGSSRNRVHDNVIAWNENGIVVKNPRRTIKHPDEGGYDYVKNVRVDHNDVIMDDPGGAAVLSRARDIIAGARGIPADEAYAIAWIKGWSGGNIYDPAANNRGHDNRYWYPKGETSSKDRYYWTSGYSRLSGFDATGGEENGRYLSDTEKDQVLANEGIPARPKTP